MPFVCVDSAIRVCVRDALSLPSQSRLCPASTEYGVFLFCNLMLDQCHIVYFFFEFWFGSHNFAKNMSQIVTTKKSMNIDLDSPRYIWSMLKDPELSTSWRGKLPRIHHQPLIHSHHSKIHHKPGAEKWWCWENLETIDVGNEWKGGIATCRVTKQWKCWWFQIFLGGGFTFLFAPLLLKMIQFD